MGYSGYSYTHFCKSITVLQASFGKPKRQFPLFILYHRTMKKYTYSIIIALVLAVAIPFISKARKVATAIAPVASAIVVERVKQDSVASYAALYDSLALESKGLSREAFDIAIAGYEKLAAQGKIRNTKLSIVDFSQPSTRNRLYIIDLAARKLLFHTLVAHGRNSGNVMATRFSNTNESLQSSLGFFVTGEKYIGKHGLSLRMDGQENSNNNARARAIVVHGADYVSERFVKQTGYLGRSWGCPAVNPELNEPIINTIGNGSCLFIYSPQSSYISTSHLAAR